MLGSGAGLAVLCTQHEPSIAPPLCKMYFSALSKLRSCQPTKELQAIKCRRMRIITSLIYSVESPVPRSCLPSSLSAPQLEREWGNDLLYSPREETQSWDAERKKCVDDPNGQLLLLQPQAAKTYLWSRNKIRVNELTDNESFSCKCWKKGATIKADQLP